MIPASATKPKAKAATSPVVASDKLPRTKVWGESDPAVRWAGAFAVYGGHGTTASSTIVYEIEPGGRLGWHTDATEETQYIIAGTGKLYLEDGCRRAPASRIACGSRFTSATCPVSRRWWRRRKTSCGVGRLIRRELWSR